MIVPTPELHVVRGSCHHDCPDTCIWDVTVSDGRAVRLRGNDEHPTTRGQLCPKVNRFLDRVYHPDRILTPLRRTGVKGAGDFMPISWDAAIGEIAERFTSLIDEVGASSILQFSFAGTQGVIQMGIMADRFFDQLGASDIRRHLCGVTAFLGAADVFGTPYGIDPEDLAHARTIILWGTNTYLTNRHLWPVIEEARAAGATVVVIDPIRTSTAERADEFIQLRPGSDTALVLAMVHVIDREGLVDPIWITEHTNGWAELSDSARAMSPEAAAEITGIDADRIEWLARTFATNRPAAIRTLVGPEHRENGRAIMRAIAMLPAVTGAWRDVGGGLARSTQVYFETALNYPPSAAGRRVFNMARLGEMLTDQNLDPPIRALMVHNSNPAVIVPDQNRVLQGLERDELFTVVSEQFMTDTARYADIILPAATQLEQLDLGIAWGHLYLSLNQPAIAPVGDALPNTEVFRRLATAMGLDDPALQEDDETLIRGLLDSDHPWVEGIDYEYLVQNTWARLRVPPGHRPYVDEGAESDDHRFNLGALAHESGPETPEGDAGLLARYPLMLMTRKQHLKFLNANYAGFDEHLPAEGEPLVQIHADDARARKIESGDRVEVFNDRGSLRVSAVISDAVQPGVVAVPFGWWNRHSPSGRAVNVLTNPTTPVDDLGSAAFHDTLVEVARMEDPSD